MANWFEQITPNEYVVSIYEIDLDKLWAMGKRIILSDLDNTLVPWNLSDVPDSLQEWFHMAQNRGFTVCILSNNKGQRVDEFSMRSGIPAIGHAKKPKANGFIYALQQFQATAQEAVMIGDQLFTDIRGGNRLGMYTILVLPIHPKEWFGTRITRQIEKLAMRRLAKQGLQIPIRQNK